MAAAQRVQDLVSSVNVSIVRNQISDLAREYEAIRASMPAGNERTRRMEVCATKMRTFALAAEPLLPELVGSTSPGERLLAVMILQVRPRAEYLEWLADRVKTEKPFVGYHAAVALLTAARILGPEKPRVLEAVHRATEWLEKLDTGGESDRLRALRQAEREAQATTEDGHSDGAS
jgi:hypothetical protein